MPDRLRPPELIKTDRLDIRRLRERDADAILEMWAMDAEVTRYLSWPTHDSLDDTQDYTRSAVKAWEDGSEFIWTIERSGEVIGGISFRSAQHVAELGFVLRRDAWNQGLMTEAVKAVVAWLQREPAILRIQAICHVNNEASRRVLEKAGLQQEGTLRSSMVFPNLGPVPQDVHMFAQIPQRPEAESSEVP